MPKNNFENSVRIGIEKRSLNIGQSGPDDFLSLGRPLSLSAGPSLIWLNAIGDPDAQAITEAWRPKFRILAGSTEHVGWQ